MPAVRVTVKLTVTPSSLTLETAVDKQKLRSILHYDGLPMAASCVVDGINQLLERGVAA